MELVDVKEVFCKDCESAGKRIFKNYFGRLS